MESICVSFFNWVSKFFSYLYRFPSVLTGRDNPNVNKTVETMIDKELRSEREKK